MQEEHSRYREGWAPGGTANPYHPPGPDTLLPVQSNFLGASIPNSGSLACLDSRCLLRWTQRFQKHPGQESRARNNGRGERGTVEEASRNNNQDR